LLNDDDSVCEVGWSTLPTGAEEQSRPGKMKQQDEDDLLVVQAMKERL
jgi:hypothetical protein